MQDTAPTPTVNQITRLFASGTNLGQTEWTNMVNAGVLPSDESYIVLAIRCYVWYVGTNALLMHKLTETQLYLSFVTGPKPQFTAPSGTSHKAVGPGATTA